ncbi:hypothetical protein WJX74_002905 [Apatococcus lobatus]|uniref:Fungal-type protein kinase domain-containing protein n=1 Tax=Apatococcus lobatus TaxID=904363 RepID=A0AAW1R130_9CHLO
MAGAACIGPPSVWGIFGQMQAATNSSGCLHSSAEYYLSRILSQAHSNATGKAAAKNINDAIPGAVSSLGGGEAEMMLNFRGILLEYFRSQIPHVIPTLEPTSAALESSAESDGAVPVYDSDLGLKLPNILLIEGREDWGKGDGSNPFAQLIAYYAKAVFSRQREPLVKNTVFPAFGLEVFGNNIRRLLQTCIPMTGAFCVFPGCCSGHSIKRSLMWVTTAPYPSTLHAEAGKAGVVPQLSQKRQKRYPGGQHLVEMEYLDPQHGWISLANFDGDWASARFMLEELLQKWQACCDNKAVHGDLRPPNIFLRLLTGPSWRKASGCVRKLTILDTALDGHGRLQRHSRATLGAQGATSGKRQCVMGRAPSSIQADAEAFAS